MEIIEQTHGPSMNEGHLGGFSLGGDGGTYYPIMWKYLVDSFNIKSVMDIGCGRGFSAKFFKSLGCEVVGIDGCTYAKDLTLLDEDEFIFHDFTKGELIVKNGKLYDLGWTCEFVEHVEEQYIKNYMKCVSQCKHLAMTFAHPGQGGHHHVNENTQEYWISKMNEYGFIFDENMTNILRSKANDDRLERQNNPKSPFFISHFVDRGLFFNRI